MIEFNAVSEFIKAYNLTNAAPLLVIMFYLVKWDRRQSIFEVRVDGKFKLVDERIDSNEETLEDHEKRIRETEKSVLFYGKGYPIDGVEKKQS